VTATLTRRECELARHALGLPNKMRRSYRNRYFIDATAPAGLIWLGLVARGLAIIVPSPECDFDQFCLTHASALAALEPGETLDEEDFPR
jgi:hypothetical protein